MAAMRKTPTPSATATIRMALGIEGTCSASTCRSGSDMVMIKPRMKHRRRTTPSFLD